MNSDDFPGIARSSLAEFMVCVCEDFVKVVNFTAAYTVFHNFACNGSKGYRFMI